MELDEKPEAPPIEWTEPVRVLMVDDRPQNLQALDVVLGDMGYDLVKASSGKEALRHLLGGDFALILLDVNLPDIDGFQTAKLVRERERTRHLPIIFITALKTDEIHVFRGYEVGAVDYISTPIVPEILRAKVRVFVDLFKLNREIRRQAVLLQEAEAFRVREEAFRREKQKEKEAALLLERKARELERSNAELQQFAYVASHDLKEPLRMVRNNAQLLKRRYSGSFDEEARQCLQYIDDGAGRMYALINDLLAYSQLGRGEDAFHPIDGNRACDAAIANLQQAIKESGAAVSHGDLPALHADGVRLTQVFQNLIGNGIKYRGTVPPRISIAAEETADFWHFSVTDNGIGIDPQYHQRIFVIFQRLHSREEYTGNGIGLAICKKIVEMHGGRIWVESAVGRGAAFHFTIAKPSADSVQAAPPLAA